MDDAPRTGRIGSLFTGLRAFLMLAVGLYAVIFPLDVLAILVFIGGLVFFIDGALGLWAITFGGARTGNFWFDVVRNGLSILMGILILFSPMLAAIVTTTVLVYLIAVQALIVGTMEISLVLRERDTYANIWPMLLNGVLYVLFGILMLLAPLAVASVFVIFGGILAILFAIGLFALAWRLHKQGL